MSRPINRLAAFAAAAGLVIGPPLAQALPGSPAHRHACGRGGLVISVNAHPVCLSHRMVTDALRSTGAVDGGGAVVPNAVASALASFFVRHAPRGADRRLTAVQVARVTRALIGASEFALRYASVASATTTSHSTPIEPSPGELGSGQTAVVETTAGPGQTGQESGTQSAFATACPDASGYVPAHAVYAVRTSLSLLQAHRLRLLTDISLSAKAQAIGHVSEAGKLKDFDVVIDVELNGDGRMVGPAGLVHGDTMSTSQRMRIVFTGLDPHAYQPSEFSSAHIGSVSLSGQGTGRYDFGADGELLASKDFGRLLEFGRITLDQLRPVFEAAEKHFFDDAKCLHAEFSPSPLKVKTGSQTAVSLSVKSTKDGSPVSIDLQLRKVSNGTISPETVHAAPSSPASFAFTAAAKQGDDVILVYGASRRGRVYGHLDEQTVAPPPSPTTTGC